MRTLRQHAKGSPAHQLFRVARSVLVELRSSWTRTIGYVANSKLSELELLSFIQSVVCSNQGWLTEYSFLVSKKHRVLRDSSEHSADKAVTSAKELLEYASREFFKVTENNFDFLEQYFEFSSREKPRMCIKGGFGHNDGTNVVSIFRRDSVEYDSESRVSGNSGFLHCVETGSYYLNNDIPQSLLRGRYKNPRINDEIVREIVASSLTSRRAALVENWQKIWTHGHNSSDCYKSTLIVPMTLWNNDVSEEFMKEFGAEGADRLIFGFLCFDQEKSGFFDDRDINIGYVIADFLALFAYNFFNYTLYSTSFRTALGKSANSEDAVLKSMQEQLKNWSADLEHTRRPTIRKKTSHNELMRFNLKNIEVVKGD